MDKATIGGILLALGGIFVGLLVERGRISQILQPTAAAIVFGGTLGAVFVQFPLPQLAAATRALALIFIVPTTASTTLIAELTGYANKARRQGIVSLDNDLEHITDPFLKRSLTLAVDGTPPNELRAMMELELENQAESDEKVVQVFEAAGGFSPTIGILGAVLGLIQVMQHLQNIDEVGRGIAVAFVATIYVRSSSNTKMPAGAWSKNG